MKKLIVLTALATLLASLSGCSILGGRGAQSCDATSPAPSQLSRLRLPRVSIPWRRGAATGECTTCNQGIVNSGFADGGFVDGGYVDGGVVSSSSSLFNPDVVYEGPVLQSAPRTTYGKPSNSSLGVFNP